MPRSPAPRGWGSISPYRKNQFRVRIYIGTERVERIVPTQPIADATLKALQQRKVEVNAGVASPRGMAEDVRVRDVIPEFLASLKAGARRVYAASTLVSYRIELDHLDAHLGGRRIVSLTKSDADHLAATMRAKGSGTSHVRHVLDRLRQVIGFAVERGFIAKAPFHVQRPRYNRNTATWCPSEHELAQLVAATAALFDRRAFAITVVGADEGPRVTELCQLRVRDVDLEHGLIRIESRGETTDRTKNAQARILPIFTSRSRKALAGLMSGRQPDERIFDARDADKLSTIVGPAWRKTFGFEPKWHGLRRRFATWRALAGDPVPVIQKWLGHASIETTMGYIRIPEEALRRGAKKRRTRGALPK